MIVVELTAALFMHFSGIGRGEKVLEVQLFRFLDGTGLYGLSSWTYSELWTSWLLSGAVSQEQVGSFSCLSPAARSTTAQTHLCWLLK